MRFAGYGGAKVQTPGLPDHLQVPFREKHHNGHITSEAVEFFQRVDPDVLVLHEAPYGYLDTLPGYGHGGSIGIRNYIDETRVKLVLSGHYHEHWGALEADGTTFMNPSNFGRTVEVSRTRPGGYFLDLLLEGKEIRAASLRQIDLGTIFDVLDYRWDEGVMSTIILDEKRYAGMGGKIPRVQHTRPIRQLQRIKSFFLGYETPETLDLVKELRSIYREIQKQGMDVAFDLLGSLSFGMADRDSDMDVVVYLRERDCVLDDIDTCKIPRPLATVFKALEERNLNVEVCDSLDLDRISRAIESEDREDGQLERFVFYRTVCRPINLRLIKSVENLLLQKESFRNEVEKGMNEHLQILVTSVRHVKSFAKYKARLQERGIVMAPDVEQAIRNYLRG
jgi:hypothetical protein